MSAGNTNQARARQPGGPFGEAAASTRILSAVPPLDDNQQQIPDPPERFIRSVATQAFEVVEGLRSISQLGAAVSVGAARQLAEQRRALRERRQAYKDVRRCVASPGRVHLCRVMPHLAEASVVMHADHRSHAVALRLEWAHHRWRACEVYVM